MEREAEFDTGSDDISLMRRAANDDDQAFEVIYLRYHQRVNHFLHGLSGNASVGSDLAQETFLRMWRFRRRYTNSGSFASYVFGIARNVWLEHCRAQKKQFSLELRQSTPRELSRFMGAASPHPDTAAGHAEDRRQILAALERLPEEQRMVFVLRSIEGLSFEEVASVLQCPVNTVRSRQITALKKLRSTLKGVYSAEATTP